jgi:tetratricopeptide (TPR) repeat protein
LAQWYAAQHDYLAATEEYRRALSDAPPGERGTYALAVARFHSDIAFGRCENGLPAAEEAARALPSDPRAWTILSNLQFSCGDPDGSRAAAKQALQRAPASAEASFYLGRALAALCVLAGARLAFITAADLEPLSAWRYRAEEQIATLGW